MNLETPNSANFCLEDNIGFVALINHTGNDEGVVNAARVSFNKQSDALSQNGTDGLFTDEDLEALVATQPKDRRSIYTAKLEARQKDRKLIRFLLEHGHETPLEHNCLTFLVKCPLFVRSQWHRHRIASINEISARYVEVKEEFYIPKKFRKQSASNRQASIDEYVEDKAIGVFPSLKDLYQFKIEESFLAYKELIESGVCREQARAVLPIATYTQFYWTVNLRAFLHFVKLRNHKDAQWEIQQYARAMLEQVETIFPETIKIWKGLN